MKLRIRGNSVRLRLSKGEVAQIEETGVAQDSIQFSPGSTLHYRVEVKPSGTATVEFDGARVRVLVPKKEVVRWLAPTEVSIKAEQDIGDGAVLSILVEKDFACLAPRPAEDDSDLFANPLKS